MPFNGAQALMILVLYTLYSLLWCPWLYNCGGAGGEVMAVGALDMETIEETSAPDRRVSEQTLQLCLCLCLCLMDLL